MPRLDASKLIEILLTPPQQPVTRFLLCDDAIFKRVAQIGLARMSSGTVSFYSGKTAVIDFVNAAGTGSLFAAAPPALVELETKLTAKQWAEDLRELERLPRPPDVTSYFFAGTAARNVIKETDVSKWADWFLTYSPNEVDAQRSAEILCRRFPGLARRPRLEQQEICARALEYYSGDLNACDLHFERMEKGGFSFENALQGQTEITAFHVVDALVGGDPALLDLRIQQCALSGEDAGAILQAVVYFFRQLAQVQAALETVPNVDAALKMTNVPFPSHTRIKKALKLFPSEKVIRFFFVAAELEMAVRTDRNPHQLLLVELSGLLRS